VLDGLSVHHQELKPAYIATVYVKQLLLPTAIGDEMEQVLHVSDGLSVHHQGLKTAYTATVYVKELLLPTAIGDEMEPVPSHPR